MGATRRRLGPNHGPNIVDATAALARELVASRRPRPVNGEKVQEFYLLQICMSTAIMQPSDVIFIPFTHAIFLCFLFTFLCFFVSTSLSVLLFRSTVSAHPRS